MRNDILFWDVDTQYDFMRPEGKLYVPGAEEIIEKFLLPRDHVGRIVADGRIAEIGRCLHVAECFDQQVVIGLRLVDQDIDADGFRLHRVELGERLRQGRSVEGRSLAGVPLGVSVERHHDDTRVLRDLARVERSEG